MDFFVQSQLFIRWKIVDDLYNFFLNNPNTFCNAHKTQFLPTWPVLLLFMDQFRQYTLKVIELYFDFQLIFLVILDLIVFIILLFYTYFHFQFLLFQNFYKNFHFDHLFCSEFSFIYYFKHIQLYLMFLKPYAEFIFVFVNE